MTTPLIPDGYSQLLDELKKRIAGARVKAALAVNQQLVTLYWNIGRQILERQGREGWGAKVLERLSADLRRTFPGMRGLSARNLAYMRDLAREWPDAAIVPQLVAQLPWGHNRTLIHKVKDREKREWYIRACIENGWSRNVFEMQIESGLFERRGTVHSNFDRTLAPEHSELIQQTIKDPYNFEFLGIAEDVSERVIEKGLVAHMEKFLIELGQGFAFLGSQVPMKIGEEEYYLDLLFYHLKLRRYVVLELKAGSFKPEYAGKLNFYLSAVDDLLRHSNDEPSIGLILCRGQNDLAVEYSLRDMSKPLGVSKYQLIRSLPKELEDALPSVEQIEAELANQERS